MNNINRTLAIIDQLLEGKRLSLPSGFTLAMGEDYSIGFLMTDVNSGEERVTGDLSLAGLHKLLDKEGVSFPL